jgi:putative hydrolase of the HAD superfamily
MKKKHPFKHIFFDLDRTLWDYDQNVRDALNDLYIAFLEGKVVGDADTFIRVFLFENGRLWEKFTANKINKKYLRDHRFLLTLRRMGLPDKQLGLELEEAYMATTPAKQKLLPGVHESLKYLQAKYDLHIITNGFEDAQQFKLSNSGIRDYFSHVVTSDTAGATKPNREIFLYSERVTGARPEECLMIGDDERADVYGAQKAGWKAIHFDPHSGVNSEEKVSELLELTWRL